MIRDDIHRFLPIMAGANRRHMYCGEQWVVLPDERHGCPGRGAA